MEIKRLKYVSGVSMKSPEIKYLYEHHHYNSSDRFVFNFLLLCSIKGKNRICGAIRFHEWNKDYDRVANTSISGDNIGRYEQFECNIFEPSLDYEIEDEDVYYVYHNKENLILFKEVPLLMDDDNFHWKDNTKYDAKETVIRMGAFEYQCIVNSDGGGKVIVRYVKCENFHRTKVTIAEFDVKNAYNESFIEAINKWNKEFKESIAA